MSIGGLPPSLLIDSLGVVAVRFDEEFRVCEVVGDILDMPVGGDIRENVPALYGLEEMIGEREVDLWMPFVQVGSAADMPVALKVRRDEESGDLWLFLRDVREESAMHRQLVQNHNSLSLAQAELVRARDAARRADQAKTAFLANVSHELRTPLHVIIGGAAILTKARPTPLEYDEVVDYAADIHESGVLLLQLVDDLIDLSRSETGNLILYEERCDLSTITAGIVDLCSDLPEARHIRIDCTVPETPVEIFADARRIKQILLNLVSNAVKAVANLSYGEVAVTLDRGELPPHAPRLVVSDNGPGMTAEALEIARMPFGQPDSKVRAKGAGLGLAIVERLVGLHGATFEIETAPNQGLAAKVTFDPLRDDENTVTSRNVS
jgi:signal transduction histidine kinase